MSAPSVSVPAQPARFAPRAVRELVATYERRHAPEHLPIRGSADRVATNAMPLDNATAGDVSFLGHNATSGSLCIDNSGAGIVVCTEEAAMGVTRDTVTLLLSPEPRLTFARILDGSFASARLAGVHPTAWVHPDAMVASDAYVGAFAVVQQDCVVGPECVLHAHVCLYPGTRLGARVIVHAGAVIGADGFGYHRNVTGTLEKFPHLGGVQIHDDVEIGANACIDRGTLGDTVVEARTRIDNLVHIAHNVVIGADCAVVAHAMIAGSARIDAGAWIAPGATILDGGVCVGAGATVGMGAVVLKHVPAHTVVVGNPARTLAPKSLP